MQTVAITGAAGNLGSILAKGMLHDELALHLLIHQKDVSDELKARPNTRVFRVDLNDASTLPDSLAGVDTIVHFAGVLFQARPEQFLPQTNLGYFKNLLMAAKQAQVKRVILISFPHVEGETSPEHPATGRTDGSPISAHASTRLEEEKHLLAQEGITPIILRVGMVYGRGILMIDAARFFSRFNLLGVWREPTPIHLISTADFVAATKAAILKESVVGIYHLGDEGIQTLQEFLALACKQWHTWQPWHMPLWMINTAASGFELISALTGWRSPLTRDFIKIGRVSYYGDTTRMRQELLAELRYKTVREGINTL